MSYQIATGENEVGTLLAYDSGGLSLELVIPDSSELLASSKCAARFENRTSQWL